MKGRLQEEDHARLAAAFLVLHAVRPAVPVLPDDPLQVLDLESEQREDPNRELRPGHEDRVVPEQQRVCPPPFGRFGPASRLVVDVWNPGAMRIAVVGPSGSGKTWVSEQVAGALGVRHIEIDALFHGPNWESCTLDELRDRVAGATERDGWVSDGTYHQLIGELVLERAETIAWLDLPVRLVMWRLVRRSYVRKKNDVELWHGNKESGWRDQFRYLLWPAFKRAFENRRNLPSLFARHPHLVVHRLRSDRQVRVFLRSLAADSRTAHRDSAVSETGA
jgi:hypothetical protein